MSMRHHNGNYKDCWPGGVAEKSTPLDLPLFLLLLLSLLVGSVPPDLLLEAMNSTVLIDTILTHSEGGGSGMCVGGE